MIRSENRIELQDHYECAAYSSAYVLRHLGVDADGNELYKKYPRKLSDGTVSPKGIIVFFKKLGYHASFFYGNVNTLKMQLRKGIPVIVFIRVFPDQRYLHFVPVVGYDREHFYLAESLKHTINCTEAHYTRKITVRDFEKLWSTWVPYCKQSYIVIGPRTFD
ncbi:cysteine peptidase family C39 domain-containing protein [Paenibacillus sp. TRM 82003]|nr:cysteine peptidase family C39 domain-containing protein [Paenibacillus sp. TRM 82003]